MIIDLRSDTLTKPTPGMLDAMMSAQVGDDVYQEDPSINALESEIASLFGKSKALFFPTGTMATQAAIKLHTQPGDQVICDVNAHIYHYEGGGASFNSGVSCRLLEGINGMFTADQVVKAINPPDFYHSPKTAMVEIENTTNRAGGACWDFKAIKEIREVCNTHNLGLHLDGARLWNALEVKSETAKDYGQVFDTISICLSKGLGCPVGSVLVGDDAIMQNALRIRKIFGGGMRQIGYLGAAGLYALKHHRSRLIEDHKRAFELAALLNEQSYIKTVVPVETNIVIFELKDWVDEVGYMNLLASKDIKISSMGSGKLRMVTHLDYTESMHDKVQQTLRNLNF